ncbi:hypothetical protein ACIBL3_40510 [Kribbella sp. NPDC050124]|uniref:hypothetical protein n=1 Tax=Kribbella sp. NPDC050124 TaxID=3364114 RepID=UPI0037A083FD
MRVVWPPFDRARRSDEPARRADDAAAVRLPPDLVGPVELALARAVDAIPGETALPGGSRYEPRWDGYLH